MSAVQAPDTMVDRRRLDVEFVGIGPYSRRKNIEDTVCMECWGRVEERLDWLQEGHMESTLDGLLVGMEFLGFGRRVNMRCCTEAGFRSKGTVAEGRCDAVNNEVAVEPLRPEWSEGTEVEVFHGTAALPYPQAFLVPLVVSQCDAFPWEGVI